MIIFGTSGITSVQTKGTYHCPACGVGAGYQHKCVTRFFTLFFVPLIPMGKVADFILCDRCGGTFKPEVLSWGGMVPISPTGGPPTLPGAMPPPVPQTLRVEHASPGFNHGPSTTVTYQANGMAKASMILGILGVLSSFLFCPSVFFCIAGLVLGIIGLSRVKAGQGLVVGKNQAIAGIATSAVGLMAILVLGILVAKDGNPNPKSTSQTLREAATLSISPSAAQTAFGNTPKAVKLAEKYSNLMSAMHQVSFESSKGASPKSSKYVVHCELHENTCAFLACVPQYRKFDAAAKASLDEIAWSTAQAVISGDSSVKPDSELCVALKGVLMFGSVMSGKTQAAAPATRTNEDEDMDRFFEASAERQSKLKDGP